MAPQEPKVGRVRKGKKRNMFVKLSFMSPKIQLFEMDKKVKYFRSTLVYVVIERV
jgi:hypothetical protein